MLHTAVFSAGPGPEYSEVSLKPSNPYKLACRSWRAESARPRRWPALAAGLLVLGLGAAQAALVSGSTETQTDTPANAQTARVGVGVDAGGKELDKAVQSGVSTGSRNLDLLLEIRSDTAAANKPASSRGDSISSRAALPGGRSLPSQTGNPTPLPSLTQNPLLGSDAISSRQRSELLQAKRGSLGEGSSFSESAGNDRRRLQAEAIARDVSANGGDDRAIRVLPLTIIQFLRDNFIELLTAVALLALVGAGLKAYSRRV